MSYVTINPSNGQAAAIRITTNVTQSNNVFTPTFAAGTDIVMTGVQDVQKDNKTGIYSFETMSDTDKRKTPTPADNKINMNVIIDDGQWFPQGTQTNANAASLGMQQIANKKLPVGFRVYYANSTANSATARYTQGTGYISDISEKVATSQTVWATPIAIEVDGGYTQAGTTTT